MLLVGIYGQGPFDLVCLCFSFLLSFLLSSRSSGFRPISSHQHEGRIRADDRYEIEAGAGIIDRRID